MKRAFLTLLSAVLLALPLAPAARAQETQTITIWHNWQGEYLKAKENLFRQYERENPGVRIELLNPPQMVDKLFIAVPAGQGPDIVAWVHDNTGRLVEGNLVRPLNELTDVDALASQFDPVAIQGGTYRGLLWGVPEAVEAITFIYNRDLISEDQLPTSTDDLLAKAQAYSQANPGQYYFVYPVKDAYFNAPWIFGNGGWYVDEQGNVGLNSEGTVNALRLVAQFRDIMPAELDYATAMTLFQERKAAIIMNGPWAIQDIETSGINYGLAQIPVVSATGRPAVPFVGVKMLYVTTNARNPAVAMDVLRFFSRSDNEAYTSLVTKEIPASIEAQRYEAIQSLPTVVAFGQQVSAGIPMPNTPFMTALWDPVAKTLEAVWTGSLSPEEAAAQGQALAEEAVAKVRR